MGSDNNDRKTQVEDPSKVSLDLQDVHSRLSIPFSSFSPTDIWLQPDAPKEEHKFFETVRDKFQAHQAQPGPAIPKQFNAPEEGTKEERRAKAQELNK